VRRYWLSGVRLYLLERIFYYPSISYAII